MATKSFLGLKHKCSPFPNAGAKALASGGLKRATSIGKKAALLLALILALAPACTSYKSPTPPPTPAPSPTPSPSPTPYPSPPKEVTLTIWLPDVLFLEGKPGKEELEAEIKAFEQANPQFKVKVYTKKARGKGGILHLLLSAHEVAPSVLPDLVVMDAVEAAGIEESLFQPLEVIPEGLFPFATGPRTIQLAANIDHMVYNTGVITSPPTSFWGLLESGGNLLLFPSGETVAIQYLALGGSFVDERGAPALREEILAGVLRLWEEGLKKGAISPLSLEVKDQGEVWKLYISGKVAVAGTRASNFLASRGKLRQTAFAPLPSAIPIAWGWRVGVITQEPGKKEVAWGLINHLLSPERNLRWALAANLLPVHREAYSLEKDSYLLFLSRLLESAQPAPPPALLKALEEALQSVLEGKATPEEAARRAAESFR